MNVIRFLGKCLFNRPAAIASAKLVIRILYSKAYWFFNPTKALRYRFSEGGYLLIEPGRFSTLCVWPAIEHYEPDVQACLRRILGPGKVFVDCGANIGFFSALAAGLVGEKGRVIAIEANPEESELLERNLRINGLEPGLHCALTSEPGEVDFLIPYRKNIYSSLRITKYFDKSLFNSVKVEGRRLDDVIKERALAGVDLVKIDLEGAELEVLQSSPYLLGELRPVIITEYGTLTWPPFGATPENLMALANRFRYAIRLFDTEKQKLTTITECTWKNNGANLVLVPEERLKELE
ncbi:MAG: FkbM family methyltransferase [Candidatus Omnitrophica bacterium]|nr:FkbM family methyltransferase [Candidatus Omnitrophota bacterium]